MEAFYRGLGRRKSSSARVVLKTGTGKFFINKRPAEEYLNSDLLLKDIFQTFEVTATQNQFDIQVNVSGGGVSGQAGAIRLGIARALILYDESLQPKLKKEKLLTRDSRAKERKKYGLRKARRARQFSKR